MNSLNHLTLHLQCRKFLLSGIKVELLHFYAAERHATGDNAGQNTVVLNSGQRTAEQAAGDCHQQEWSS